MKFVFLSSFAHLALDPKSTRVSGGAELQAALMASALARRGHEVIVLGADEGQPEERILQGVRARKGGRFHTGGIIDTLRALPIVFRFLRKERPHFTFVYGWTTWTFFLLWPAFLKYTRAGFVCMLDTEVNGEFRRAHPVRGALFECGVRNAAVRFAITQYHMECFARLGVDCTLYRPLVFPRQEPPTGVKDIDLLWIARCDPIKRPHLFLDLAERLPGARCLMVSPNENADLFRTVEARARGLPNVEFRERVPYHQVQALYDAAQIFVNTSTWEGFANSFVQSGQGEAAILSLAVDTDHLLERFNAGACAGDNFEAFVAHARRLLAEPKLLRAQQLGAAAFVREWHDNEQNVDAFLSGLPK